MKKGMVLVIVLCFGFTNNAWAVDGDWVAGGVFAMGAGASVMLIPLLAGGEEWGAGEITLCVIGGTVAYMGLLSFIVGLLKDPPRRYAWASDDPVLQKVRFDVTDKVYLGARFKF